MKRAEEVLQSNAANCVIFGSAAVALNGFNLGRPVGDLDIFVSEDMFNFLADRFGVKYKAASEGGDVPYILPVQGMNIEILKSFPGVTFDDVLDRSRPIEDSPFRLASSEDLKAWKGAQGRLKDIADLDVMNQSVKEDPS